MQMVFTVDDLREDAAKVREFLVAEVKIRRSLAERRPLEREVWNRKEKEAKAVLDAHDRLNEYIAGTDPAERLPGRAKQAALFGQ